MYNERTPTDRKYYEDEKNAKQSEREYSQASTLEFHC